MDEADFHKMRKIHIFLDLNEYPKEGKFPGDWPGTCMTPRSASHQLSKRLIEKKNLKECSVEITVSGSSLDDRNPNLKSGCDSVEYTTLSGFGVLRCEQVSIHGLASGYATELIQSILRPESVQDVYKKSDALVK
jgi:hypothetical protein